MRGFIEYVGRFFWVGRSAYILFAAWCVVMGVDPATGLLGLVKDVPSWLASPWTKLGFIALAILAILWASYQYSRIEVAVPERLKRRRYVQFHDIAGTLSATHIGYSTQELQHRLLKAMWMGDFENGSGVGRLTLSSACGVRLIDDRAIPLSQTADDTVDADTNQSRTIFNKKHVMLETILNEPRISQAYKVSPLRCGIGTSLGLS